MEENTQLFSLSIDPATKQNLSETAKWVRVLAIAGSIFMVLAMVLGFYQFTMLSELDDQFGRAFAAGRVAILFSYIIIIAVAFFPIFYMFRFSARMRTALAGDDQQAFNEAFQYLKLYFRYLGVITIIVGVLYALGLFIGVIGASTLT